jgi:hypothetical protein
MSEISDTSDDSWYLATKERESLTCYKDQHDGRMEKAYASFLQLEYKVVSLDEITHLTEEVNKLYIKALSRLKSAIIELRSAADNVEHIEAIIEKSGVQLTDYTKQWIEESKEV